MLTFQGKEEVYGKVKDKRWWREREKERVHLSQQARAMMISWLKQGVESAKHWSHKILFTSATESQDVGDIKKSWRFDPLVYVRAGGSQGVREGGGV